MGGSNQSTCPPATSPDRRVNPPKRPGSKFTSLSNPIRFHEVTSRGEVDFHDDEAKIKCAVNSASFFDAYNEWRPKITDNLDNLVLSGNDGKGGHSAVTLIPYMDDQGAMQVAMTVQKASVGQTICDLDKLAHFP